MRKCRRLPRRECANNIGQRAKRMAGYLIRVWCRDCCDEDPQGCFDGSHTFWGDKDAEVTVLDDPVPFATKEAAEAQAWKRVGGAHWDFDIVDAETKLGVESE